MKVVKLSARRTGRLYPTGNIPVSFCYYSKLLPVITHPALTRSYKTVPYSANIYKVRAYYDIRNSVISIVTSLKAGPSWVRIPASARDLSFSNVHTLFGAHPSSYWMDTTKSFMGYRSRARRLPLTSNQYRGHEWMELHLHPPICFRGVYRDTYYFLL
jgi:hypothetical protein